MPWFRVYTDILDDPKLAVSETFHETFHFFIMLMAYACELNNSGKIDKNYKTIAWRLRITEDDVKRHISHLEKLEIIDTKPIISFKNWGKRQFISDISTDRVKRHRNVSRNGKVTANETPPYTDTYTDTDSILRTSFFSLWDTKTKGFLPEIKKVTKKRISAFNARAKSSKECKSLSYWENIIDRILKSDFCLGNNESGWKADIDFLLRPDTHIKVLEGKYDNKKQVNKQDIKITKPILEDCLKNIVPNLSGKYYCELRGKCVNSYNGECLESLAIAEVKKQKGV